MEQDIKKPLYTLYESLKADNYDVPDSYDSFERTLTAKGDEGRTNRKTLYDALKADNYDVPDSYESFANTLFVAASEQKAAAPSVAPAAAAPYYFKLRRGGKDFTVSADEVSAAGGLSGWAAANPGAPVRVYMQGGEDNFEGHVDLSVAHDRYKNKGYRYTSVSSPIEPSPAEPQMPWKPTEQEKMALSKQLAEMQRRSEGVFAEDRERMENIREYHNNSRGASFQTVEGKPVYNPETGKMERSYLTPTGERVTDKAAADALSYSFRRAVGAADMSVGAQIRRTQADIAELKAQLEGSKSRVHDEWAEDYEKNKAPLAAVLAANTYTSRQMSDKEYSALSVAIRQKEEALKDLYEERDRQMGKDVGFWRGFGRTVSDVRTWDLGMGDVLDAMTMLNGDKYSAPNATEGEKKAGEAMMKAVYDRQQVEEQFGGNASFWNRAGVMTGYMPSFMVDFALTGGGFEAIDVAGKAATRAAAKLIGKEAIKEMAELGVKQYAKKYGVRGMGRIAENWAIKALGTTADDLLIRAPLMTNTVQAGKTAADVIDRKLGDVVIDENGNYDFSNDKTWGSAVWQGEANAIIENYSEMFGTHLDGVAPAFAKIFGGKRMSGMLARANASSYGQILATTRKQFERMGVSDYFGEVGEEYYGQLWRSMLNLDDAYTNVPVVDEQGNRVIDEAGNPVYERKNLLFTGQFHGDIWGGMALSMGLMGAGKYAISGMAYAGMKHQVNKSDRIAAEIFTPERWEPIRELIDNTTNEDMGSVVESIVGDGALSDDERNAAMSYMERTLNLRGYNLGAMARSRGAEGDPTEQELSESFIDGYEASTPREMNDAQNMWELHRQRVEGLFEPDLLSQLDTNPVNELWAMSQSGMYSQEELDAARDYVNAKTVRDGMIRRVNDDIEERIAQSDAMINARVSNSTGMIQPAIMGLDDREVYIVGGNLAMNADGTIDNEASDESIVVRDARTGALEFATPQSIVSAGEAIDPEQEKMIAADGIRQQAAQSAADRMNGTLSFNPGDTVTINDGGGLTDISIVGEAIDEASGMPIEGEVVVQFADGTQTAFGKDALQQFADAANLERLNSFEQERAAKRMQQQAVEAEAMRPQFALNDEFSVIDEDGNHIRGSVTGELDEDGKIEIYTEEPLNGYRVNRYTPEELESMIDTYNGAVISVPQNGNIDDNSVTSQHGNGPEQNHDERADSWQDDGGGVASDTAGSVEGDRDRSDIRVYEAGLVASRDEYSGYSERTRRDSEAERLIGIARHQGQYIPKSEQKNLGEKQPKRSGESEVYIDKDAGKVYKIKDPAAKSPMKGGVQPEDAIYEHLVHNKYFPETRYRFEGISDDMGDLRIVLSQGYVNAVDNATDEQIEAALAERGLYPEGNYRYGNDEISVTDVTGDNALLGADGKVYFIDPIIDFKKPIGEIIGSEEGSGGSLRSLETLGSEAKLEYTEADPATAWDAIVEQAEGDEDIAAEVVADYVSEAQDDFNAAEKALAKTKEGKPEKRKKGEPAPTMEERIAAKKAAKEALGEAQAIRDEAKAILDHWQKIANTKQNRERERRNAEDAERRRLVQERAAEEARLKAEREEAERIEREEAERWETEKRKLDKRLRDTAEEVRDVPEALDILQDMNPQSMDEVAAWLLSGNKLLWSDKEAGGRTTRYGVGSQTGLGDGERKRLFGLFASAEKGGVSIDTLAEDRFKEACDAFGVGYDNQDARDALIDRIRESRTIGDIRNYIADRRIEQAKAIAAQREAMDAEERERQCREAYHRSYDEWEAYEEQAEDDGIKLYEDFDEQEFYSNIADEIERQFAENEYREDKGAFAAGEIANDGNGGGVLPTSQFVETGGGSSAGSEGVRGGIGDRGKVSDTSGGVSEGSSPGGERDGAELQHRGTGRDAAGRSLTREEASDLISLMESNAEVAPEIELTIENWDAQFGEDGIVSTPIGEVKMGENQFAKLMRQGRNGKLGMIKPTLENPDIIIEDASEGKAAEATERRSSYIFVKTFIKPDGSRYYYFTSVTVSKDGKEVIVSSQEKSRNRILRLMQEGSVVWRTPKDATTPSAEEQGLDYEQPMEAETATKGSGLTPQRTSSEGKGNALLVNNQEVDRGSSLGDKISVAEADVNLSPTDKQKEAGNYKKGHVQVGAFDVTIEQPVGSVRHGTDADGKSWETEMHNTYGYIRGTEGVDGDHIDVFLSTDIDSWTGRRVVIVDQYNPDGSFDEHKVMLGFNDMDEAKEAYLSNYEQGWENGRRLVFSSANIEDFEKWIDSSHRKTKAFHEYVIAQNAEIEESNPKQAAAPDSDAGYSIDTYKTKKGKEYVRVVFPRADKEIWQQRVTIARKMGGVSVPKGYGFKTREEAEAFANSVIDTKAVSDAQPLSLEDMRPATGIEEAETANQSETVSPVNPSGNKLVSDERYAQLRERMRKKLLGQLNMGVDPEILAIGTEMAVYHIEKGARKFTAYAKAMIADLGDAIRPYLKSFYNAVRDMPEADAAGLVDDMDSYDDVRSVDIANFDKNTTDAMATAEAIIKEQEVEKERQEAEEKLKVDRNIRHNPDGSTTKTVVEGDTEFSITEGDFIPGVSPAVNEDSKPTRKNKTGKAKSKSTTEGSLFDLFGEEAYDIQTLAVPEQRPTAELVGDSATYQSREAQIVELVEEIGGVIDNRIEMLQLDPESVKPLTMTEVKKMAKKYSELGTISDTDLQELVELAMTQLTRSEAIINVDGSAEQQRAAFDRIVSLYQMQPSLNARDSERTIKQQYSTPTPFGYVMGQFVRAGGKDIESMLEPSAGNGALTITVRPSVVHVNDIDDARLSNLRKLGYKQVTAQDALLPFSGEKVDVVMTNPPFGTVSEKVYEGIFHISSLEGQMAINALEQMKDDGRAAIVIGGNTSYRTNGSMNPKDAAFFGYLYSRYNVADVINISGKALYSRNGTGYDVRMILIDGRKTGEFQRVYPPVKAKARAEQITTFDELYNRIQDDIHQIQQVGSQSADVQRDTETATDGASSPPVRGADNRTDTRTGERPGSASEDVGNAPKSHSGQSETNNDGRRPDGVDNADAGNAGSTDNVPQSNPDQPRSVGNRSAQNGTGRGGSDGRGAASSRPDRGAERLEVKPDLTTEKVPYPNQSENGFTLMSVVPAAQAQVLQRSLGEIGDVDQYLVDELGYSSKEELYSYLAAEQIDSVALAIHQMSKGNAFIIGDMTGVGKGRQGAALIRYAVNQGRVPIYFTQKPTLFTDNYRDLADIGSSDLRPFIIASNPKDASIVDADGNMVHKLPSKKEQQRVFDYIMEHGTLPDEYDYVLTTYDQIKNGTADYSQNEDGSWNIEARKLPKKSNGYTTAGHNGQTRRDALAALADGNIAILDESHTVGGDSGCGRYMQMLTAQAEGVTFLSATFAKRADNMPIYAQRTAIAEAGVKASELIEAIMKGGVTLQEIMSKQLVESGQMIRRERSFEGVTIDWLSVEEETDRKQRVQFNEVADIFNSIRNFQNDHIKPIIEGMNEAAAEQGATVGLTHGTKDLGVKNTPFASKMYNLVNQLLFALKVDAVADRVIENLRNGFKPVISFTNTMEGFLSSAPKGEAMDEVPNFSLTLMRALDGVMRFTEKDADENSEGGTISLSQLGVEGQNSYNSIRDKIMNLSADLPISPMDAIRMKIEEAGYTVAEITGRSTQLNRTDDGRYIVEARKDRDKKAAMRDFNSGKLDVLMINKSGSTGISLHASSKFEDKRQRVMVFAQFQSDINDEVQMRGRIDRSGQVTRGRYEYIMSTIPAEQRIQMMFKAKLKSLDANTTSSQKSKFNEMEIVDYLNKYGDDVVWEYMKEHPELEERLGDPLKMLQEGKSEDGPRTSDKEDTSEKNGCAGKISRYLAFLSVEEQDEIFREITEAYRVKIQLLDDAGENDLEITTMPLRAETKRKQVWHQGENPNSGNAFADHTYVEEVEVDVLKKPMKRAEIADATRKFMGDLYTEKNGSVDWAHYAKVKGEEIQQFYTNKANESVGKLKEAGEARIAKAREKAVRDAIKARGRGENSFSDADIQSLADTVAEEARDKEQYKQQKRHEEIMSVNTRIQSMLNRLRAENIYVIPTDLKQGTAEMFSQTFGTFVGFKFNKGFTLGSSTAIFATLDGRRKVELALSDNAINTIISATEIAYRYSPKEIGSITMENWDSKVPNQTRQKRYIITGNLLQALVDTEKGEKTRGNLISYSTIDGETRQGILMGENFKLTDLRNSIPLSSRLEQIREGKAITSENGDVTIAKVLFGWQHRGDFELSVPKSKQRGGIYYTDPGLLQLVDGNNFVTKGDNMVGYIEPSNLDKVVEILSRAPFKVTVLQESTLTNIDDTLNRQGDGYGAYTDAELSYLNDPISKALGKNRFSKARQGAFAARERQRMVNRLDELAERMRLGNVEIVTDVSELSAQRARSKGFFNKISGKITIVLPNNVSMIDAEQTLLHEAVAHYGLRELFGSQFDTFLDNVYEAADESIRREIAAIATKNGWNFRTATEEYLASLAEDTNFEHAHTYAGWWSKIKSLFLDMLEKIGFEGFRDKVGVVLTDNELRYILWRSYQNLVEPGRYRSILGEAADVAKQYDLKAGNYAESGIAADYAAEPTDIAMINDRFNEQLATLTPENADRVVFHLGTPSGILRAGGVENKPLKLYGNKVIKKMKKHGFALTELRDLPKAMANPIAVFNNISRNGNRSILTKLRTAQGNILVGIDLGKGGEDIDFNIVSSVFGKGKEKVIYWIENGLATYLNKKQVLDYLHHSAPIAEALSNPRLETAAKIVKEFENPAIEGEELYRPGDFSPRDKQLARDAYNRICASGSYQFKEAVQDSMLGLKELYKAIEPGKRIEDIAGFENAYLYENRMSSTNASEQHEYFQRYMRPLLNEIARLVGANKRKRRDLTDYLMAKHGLERNEYMRNDAAANGEETDRDFAGLIGLTGETDWVSAEAVARQWVDDYEASVDTADLWDAINNATKATLEKVYLSGLISKETFDKISGMYKYYIPLRGWDETTSDKVYGYLMSNKGPLGGSIMKKAEGRKSKADDPIATIGMMADDAIRQGNRNLMKQRFLNFILNHPSDAVSVNDLWLAYSDVTGEWVPVFADVEETDSADEVALKVDAFEQRMEALHKAEPDKYKKGRDAQHIPYKVAHGNLCEHQILIKRNGRTFVATINGNPRAAQAINGLTNPDVDQNGVMGNMLKGASWINRQLSAFYTTRNPDFVVSNFFRDMLYSNCMTWVKESPRYALRFSKNFGKVNPAVMRRLLGKWENGTLDKSNRLENLFYQFMKNGGETGYTNVRDTEGHKRAVAAELKKITDKNIGYKSWRLLSSQLDLLNRSAENCARFAAFVTSRDFGRSIDRSIYDAKEISVNFNKKGSGGKMVNATGQTTLGKAGAYVGGVGRIAYVFWNAGIQGMTNFCRQAKLHPGKFSVGAASLFALGYVIPMLAQMLGGGDGDDDDKNAYYNLPEYVRRSNICFYASKQWVTIPLPIEYRAMYGLGELAHGVISGNERYSNEELAHQMAAQVTQILPVDMLEGGGGISPLIPSAAKPFTEAYIMNKGWTGLPVYKDTPFNKDDPEWTKAYASADQHLVSFAKWLNETSRGDDFKKGDIDINPAKIEYLLNGTFGGMVSFPNKIVKSAETAFGDREFDWRNMPIANRLIKSGDERTANRKLRNEYFNYKQEYEATGKLMRKYEKASVQGVMGYAEKVNFLENSPEYLRREIFDVFKPDIDAYNEAIAVETDEDEKAKLEAEMYGVMRKLVDSLHDPKSYFKELYEAEELDEEYVKYLETHHGIKLGNNEQE